MPQPTLEQIALYRHWIRADAVKQVVSIKINIGEEQLVNLPPDLLELGRLESKAKRLEVFYSLLYVVIEGYKMLGYENFEIDKLLEKAEYVDQLRRFRNAIFHYQKDPFSEKLLAFMSANDNETWVKDLHKAFDRFFLDSFPTQEILFSISSEDIFLSVARGKKK